MSCHSRLFTSRLILHDLSSYFLNSFFEFKMQLSVTGYILFNLDNFIHFTLCDCQKTLSLTNSCSKSLNMVRTKNSSVPAGEKMIDDPISKESSEFVFEESRDYVSPELPTGRISKDKDATPPSRVKQKLLMDAIDKRSSPLQRNLLDEAIDDDESALPDLKKKMLIGYQRKKKKNASTKEEEECRDICQSP